MTWIRWDCPTPFSDVVGFIAAELSIRPVHALGHYNAMCCGFGEHRPDGRIDQVSDELLETWAMWPGKRGMFAKAVRKWCTLSDDKEHDPGVLRGWWRQRALLAKQQRDRRKRKGKQGDTPETPAKPPQKPARVLRRQQDDDETERNEKLEAASSSAREVPPSVRVAVAANAGLQRNPRLTGFNELLPQQAEQLVADWTRDGISLDLICRVVEDRSARYEPGPKGRQPSSFRYFDQAVRQAHAQASGREQVTRAATNVPVFRELA
jgi:hypothetical protein